MAKILNNNVERTGVHPEDDSVGFEDPCPWSAASPWMHQVRKRSLLSNEELAKRREKAERNQLKLRDIYLDPQLKYKYETEIEQERSARRIFKDRQLLARLGLLPNYKEVINYVRRNWNHSREPTIITRGTGEGPEGGRKKRTTFREEVRKRRDIEDGIRLSRLEEEAEEGSYNYREFDTEFIETVKRSRFALGWSQKDLARKLNCTENDIKSFENNELLYNGRFQGSLKWALGINTEFNPNS